MKLLLFLSLSIFAATAGAGSNDPARKLRLRCAHDLKSGFSIEINTNNRTQLNHMRAAMLRKGTIKPTDFCIETFIE